MRIYFFRANEGLLSLPFVCHFVCVSVGLGCMFSDTAEGFA